MSLSRLPRRTTPRFPSTCRLLTTSASRKHRYLGLALGSGALAIGAFSLPVAYADTQRDASRALDTMPLTTLIRSYVVYSMCSVPLLVDKSPDILSALASIPGAKQLTDAFVRATFFSQFVGGDTAEEALPLLHRLRAENKGALFAYSVEVGEAGKYTVPRAVTTKAPHTVLDEIIRAIDVAADFEDRLIADNLACGRKTWVAVKMTALIPSAQSLINLSSHVLTTRPRTLKPIVFPGCPHSSDIDVLHSTSAPRNSPLTRDDIVALQHLHNDLVKICVRAKERQVRLIIDAEYSWYQPAIDALTLSLMQQFNKLPDDNSFSFGASNSCSVQPLVYGTYQAYLRRTPAHLSLALQHAQEYKYTLGVKLVRGAYHPHELAAHRSSPSSHHGPSSSLSISPDTHPPVWLTKAETDLCYDTCARWLIDLVKSDTKNEIPTIGILFGTHNWNSCRHILDCLIDTGLAVRSGDAEGLVNIKEAVTERITIGQLYGMSDALTNWLVETTRSRSPFVTKYVPYGALSEVMPYLCRRAIENKSILASESGGAADERRRAYAEIRRRVLG